MGNSRSGKSGKGGGTIVIVDDAAEDISALYGSNGRSYLGNGDLLMDALVRASRVVIVNVLN